AELDRRQLTRRDEEDFTDEDVAVGELVDELTEKRNRRPVERVATGRQAADKLAILEEQRDLVGVDGQLRVVRDVLVGVLVDPIVLRRIGARDRELMDSTLDETDDSHIHSCKVTFAVSTTGVT